MAVTLDTASAANSPTFSNGNLRAAATSALGHSIKATSIDAARKVYAEATIIAVGSSGYSSVGVVQSTQSLATPPVSLATVPAGMWIWRGDQFRANNGASAAFGAAWATNDIIMVAFDPVAGSLWWGRNGTWVAGDPAAGTGATYTNLTGSISFLINFFGTSGNPITQFNFGGSAFTYTIPSGFVSLGQFSITAAVGSYSLTGVAAGLKAGRVVAGAAGSYTLSGIAASLNKGRLLDAAKAAYTLSGQNANLFAHHFTAIGTGSYALTGVAATLRAAHMIAATTGNYSLLGINVGLLKRSILTGVRGTYTLTGNAALLVHPWTMPAEAAEYIVTGNPSVLTEALRAYWVEAAALEDGWTEEDALT